MQRASNVSSTTQDKGGGGAMVLECESEKLSDAQLSHIQKLKDEVIKLQNLIRSSLAQPPKPSEITVPLLVNGTSGTAVTAPITNGPNVVGLQVPQFLLLQNGQMIAASSAIQPAPITTTNPANSFPVTSGQGTVSFKTTTTSRPATASHLSQALTRHPRVTISSKSTNATPTVNSSDDIQVLSDTRSSPQSGVPRRSLREVRIQAPPGSSTPPSTSDSTTFRPISDSSGMNGVLDITDSPPSSTPSPSTPATSTTTTTSTPAATPTSSTSYAKHPLLNILARPRNTLPPSIAMSQRKELDTKVKLVLVKSAQEFVEWLLSEELIRRSQNCSIHKVQATQQPYKLKLGMFSDPKALATSGGYVWISECCGKKYISVYSGSIFGSTPIDKVPPTSVLKLIYHWSCQTSINNVENWVKVDKAFINKMYQYLRCVCSVMLQDKVYDFGFDGTTVELGIVSLGTSTADGTKKAVKVEILGLYDRNMKSYRLFASEPEPGSSSRQRFVRILKPLEQVVHVNALILCDQSVDRNCLYSMNYSRVSVCETSDNEDNPQFNGRIMTYLRKHVPKMFQSALSQLNLQQVQLVLDELCWRERYGHCAAHSYNNMMEHITYLTARESENPGVLHLLDYVAQSPQHNWRYKSQHVPKGPNSLHPYVIMNNAANVGAINPQVTLESPPVAQTPLDHTNKVILPARRIQVAPASSNTNHVATTSAVAKADSTELEPFYYGQIQGDAALGREVNNTKFQCHICSVMCENNVEFYSHLKLHLSRAHSESKLCCDYCADHFNTEEKKIFHQRVKHMHLDGRLLWCRICSEGYSNEYNLVNHMAKKHHESELPYRCEVCNFMTSIFYSLIDHFNTEHKNTYYVQCHFCLAVKALCPANLLSFSHRIYQHLQRHMHQQTRCKHCQLNFYSVYLREEHRKKDHMSRVGFPGLQRYKIPAGQKTRIMFRPYIKRQTTATNSVVPAQAVSPPKAMSTTLEWHTLKTDPTELEGHNCIECKRKLSLTDHFKSYMKCTRCSYSTCCRNMIARHVEVFHPQGRGKKVANNMPLPIIIPKPLFCICGFSTRNGNFLARHLTTCEGGRKSAYPSVSAAMVYHGDVTGGMLNLANLGLDNIGLASILPDVPINSGSIDMSHFMSMSMDVDEA